MLRGGVNILESPCKEANRSVPYFLEEPSTSMNDRLYEIFDDLTKNYFDLKSKS